MSKKGKYQNVLKYCCSLVIFSMFATTSGLAFQQPPPVPPSGQALKKYEVSPGSGERGKEYNLLIVNQECSQPFPETVTVLGGNGIAVVETKGSPCAISAKIKIGETAVLQKAARLQIWSQDKDKKLEKLLGIVEFEVAEVLPGPIPPGLDPQVDIQWDVLQPKSVRDNFGSRISNMFYCIEISLGNNSGYDLQIGSIGFILEDEKQAQKVKPSTSYRITRGTIEREQQVGNRNRVVNFLKGLGPVLTGFTPFFFRMSGRANYSNAVNIFSNPFVAAAELIFPDKTVRHLQSLDSQALRDSLIISNNQQQRILTFFPKDSLGLSLAERDNPIVVRKKLGELILIGTCIQYLNRVRVTSKPAPGVTPGPTATSKSQIAIEQGQEGEILLTGLFLTNAKLNPPDKVTLSGITIDENGRALTAKAKVDPKAPYGMHVLTLSTADGVATLPFQILQAPPKVTAGSVKYKLQGSSEFKADALKVADAKGKTVQIQFKGENLSDLTLNRPSDTQKAISMLTILKNDGETVEAEFQVSDGVEAKQYKLEVKNTNTKGSDTLTLEFK